MCVCVSLSLSPSRSLYLLIFTDMAPLSHSQFSVRSPRLAMTGRPRVRAVGKNSTDAPVDPDLLHLSPELLLRAQPAWACRDDGNSGHWRRRSHGSGGFVNPSGIRSCSGNHTPPNNLNYAVNIAREVSQRIQDTKRTWLRLDSLWKDPSSNPKWKLLIYDAVIRSKLLYSLETVHLTGTLRKKLDAFHLRGLRKILRMQTTYVNRQNTNQRVYQTALDIAFPSGNGCVKPFTELLDERRIKLAGHILRSPNSDPLRQVTYQPDSAEPVEIGKRRIGRPRQQWTFRSNELIHSKLSHTDYRGFDVQNHNILTAARQRRV